MAKVIMIQGTASNVGKTMLTIGLCRIFRQDGYLVAPFKAQNMTANTYSTMAGDEIAVSQWLQALAARVLPIVDMSPIILKPSSSYKETQIILNGKPFDKVNAYNFEELKKRLVPEIMEAYSRLLNKYDIVVIEGAGSPVELNLNKNDIVNMGMAKMANAPVLLATDIDRGGAFASLFGTINLLDEVERTYVKATIINKFRGKVSFFENGVKIIEDITKLPVAGIVPYTTIMLPEEDGLSENYHNLLQLDNYEDQFNIIADNMRKSLNMELIYNIIKNGI